MIPFGGGTSVVGGVAPRARAAGRRPSALDLGRLDAVLDVDVRSRLARVQAGLRLPELDHALGAHGLRLGHLPQSYEWATVGGCAATRSAGQASTGFGRFDELVAAVRCATPAGELATLGAPGQRRRPRPARARARLGGHARRDHRARCCACGPVAGRAALRGVAAALVRGRLRGAARRSPRPSSRPTSRGCPTRTRRARRSRSPASDGIAAPRGRRRAAGAALPAGLPAGRPAGRARRDDVARRRAPAARGAALRRRAAARAPARARRGAPRASPARTCATRCSTAACWSRRSRRPRPGPAWRALHGAVRDALVRQALAATPPVVGCHVSHLYPDGASLYFTVLARQDPRRPGRSVVGGQARGGRRDRRRGRDDHPPPRGRPRPRAVAGGRARRARRRAAARRQAALRPGGRHEPREAAAGPAVIAAGLFRRRWRRGRLRRASKGRV